MVCNAAGLIVNGAANPNWKGGLLAKNCEICSKPYSVKRVHAKSRFCSLQCVGVSQRKTIRQWTLVEKVCEECGAPFSVPAAHEKRYYCCSRTCSARRRAKNQSGPGNSNWNGGLSRFPYPYNFRLISKRIIERDGGKCQSPKCAGHDPRLTAHHIDYDKEHCDDSNLIALCSSCNSKANFGRKKWQALYVAIMQAKKRGGGWEVEEF